MKKTYQNPSTVVVQLAGGNVCQNIVVGSANGGSGTQLAKEEHEDPYADATGTTPHYDVWEEDWNAGEE